jgi:arabinogalactan oligomer/maltooligosaccharide transport system permease protein
MIFLQSWLGSAYMFLLITGMIQSIPKSLYEAAKIDGSSKWKQFKTITAPIIISQIAPLLIGQFIFNFNNFGLIYLFNEGGPVAADKTAGEFDIFISWIYKLINSRQESKPGPASAISLIISIFTVTPSIYLFLKSKSFRKGNF